MAVTMTTAVAVTACMMLSVTALSPVAMLALMLVTRLERGTRIPRGRMRACPARRRQQRAANQ